MNPSVGTEAHTDQTESVPAEHSSGAVSGFGERVWHRLRRELATVLGSNQARAVDASEETIYSIAMLQGTSLLDLKPVGRRNGVVIDRDDVTDAAAIYVADPFMLRSPAGWHMFFEALVRDREKGTIGEIGLATSSDGREWRYEQIVLREPFHLSYPYVFWYGGECYMIPETYQADEVRLYRATAFPTKWRFECTLVRGSAFVDSCPFFFNDRWWLFASGGEPPMRADILRLYSASALRGPWSEHPASPIYSGNLHMARSAGRVVMSGGRLVRFAQECTPTYGTLVRAIEVTDLTESTYAERPLFAEPVLAGSGQGWNAAGMHHIDPHLLDDGQWLACVDGCTWQEVAR